MGEREERVASAAAAAESASEVGTVLAHRYEVIRELGRGGMGVVYLCRDSVTGDRVALKRLGAPNQATEARPEENWWFQQEARAVAALDHPCIVRARDFGTLVDGSPYLAMDVLPGRSVHEWMHTTQLPWPVLWAMVDQLLAGLAHAHARGIIHGDMKPSNVMLDLASSGRGPRAYMLDLGLAWLKHDRHDPRLDGVAAPELATHSGAGTVGWVAPEQIRKIAAFVGPATDLYALGCVMYRVFTGKEVFEGSAQEVLRAHKRSPVPPPRLPDGMPSGAGTFILRLLEKKPWDRFELAGDARKAWGVLRPANVATLEEMLSGPATGRASVAMRAQSLAPGLLSLRAAPVVARDEEKRELLSVVEDVCASAKAPRQMLAFIGEAGVGKSRLAEWLCEEVHERALMIPLRARYGRIPTPLDGITAAINAHFGLEGADRALVEQTFISRWEVDKDDDEALTWVAATAEWLRPTPPGTPVAIGPTGKRFVLDRPELRWIVVRRILERIGRERPVLLWLDDLHLASPNTFDMLAQLRRGAQPLRLLIVVTARSETLATDLDAALRMEALRAEWGGRVLEVKPLGSDETESLLRQALPLHDDAIARATEQSRGNPLFALQLLHAWAGGGYLTLKDGRYSVPPEALAGRAITTAELWDERLRAIPTELRLGAYAAAALGEDIRGDVLKTLVSSLGMDARDAMMALARAQILLSAGNDQFRWPHALLQEHLLDRLQERSDAPAIYRLAANALSRHPAVGARRIMKHRVTNLLRAGDDDHAARLMFDFIEGSWRRGRDTAATLRDLEMLHGRLSPENAAQASMWRAEALRYIGQLSEARAEAESARASFLRAGDLAHEAQALRLLGHIASDLGSPVQARALVVDAVGRFEKLGDQRGWAQSEVVLGEIDYLIGNHVEGRKLLRHALTRCESVGDSLGHAQALILLALIESAGGERDESHRLLLEARAEFDSIGYRLGIAQSDLALGHADHRGFLMGQARARALASREAFRELQNPRGEGGAERLLAMVALDTGDFEAALAHGLVATKIFDRLEDPWGRLEGRLLLAQVALARGDQDAHDRVADCEFVEPDEAEPRQHRHLTRAWLAQREARWIDAAAEIDRARAAFGDRQRTGDHTPHLVDRLAKLVWLGPAMARLGTWQRQLETNAPASSKPSGT